MDRFVRVYEYFELDTILHWQPVQFYENGRDVFMFMRSNLFWKKQNDVAFYFGKITVLSHFLSRRHDVINLSIADISLILRWIEPQFGHRSGYSMVSFKISCDLECHIELLDQWQGKCIFHLYRLVCPFISPSILDRITLNFQLWSLKKGTFGFIGITSSISLI